MKLSDLEYKIYKTAWNYKCKPLNQSKKKAEEGESGKRRACRCNWAEEKAGSVLQGKGKQKREVGRGEFTEIFIK